MKYIKHLIVIVKHKYYVMIECFKMGIFWQGITHDLSKFTPSEFIQSARYFQGNGTPINKIKSELGYSSAWLNHKGRNKHHWEYWTDFYNGELKYIPIPNKYIKEMACDMVGASKAYLKKKYNSKEPLNYFLRESKNWFMDESSKIYLELLLIEKGKKK